MPKLSPPSDGATSALAPSSSPVSSSCERKPTTSMPSSGTRSRASSSRTASGSAPATREPRTRAPPDLRPRAQQHLQALARLVPAGEDDAVLAPAGVGLAPGSARRSGSPRTRRAASAPPTRGRARRRRCGGRAGSARKPQIGLREPHPAELARGVEGRRPSAPWRCASTAVQVAASSARAGGARRSAPARARAGCGRTSAARARCSAASRSRARSPSGRSGSPPAADRRGGRRAGAGRA